MFLYIFFHGASSGINTLYHCSTFVRALIPYYCLNSQLYSDSTSIFLPCRIATTQKHGIVLDSNGFLDLFPGRIPVGCFVDYLLTLGFYSCGPDEIKVCAFGRTPFPLQPFGAHRLPLRLIPGGFNLDFQVHEWSPAFSSHFSICPHMFFSGNNSLNGAHPQIQRRMALSTKGHFLDETFPINYSKCFSGEDISLINIFPLSIYRIIKLYTYSTFCVIILFAIFVQMIQALLFLS